jgi:hypothetical protein
MRYEKIRFQLPIAEKLFLIVIFHFSLVKDTMNAPHLCKFAKTISPALAMAQWS